MPLTDVPTQNAADIVIVSYRCREHIRACLEALEEHQPKGPIGIWVVDNASHDGTVEMIRSDFPNVHPIARGSNDGFAVACNLGIREGKSGYVLTLNPDTRIAPGALDQLLQFMDQHPEVGICGCRLMSDGGILEPAAKRAFPTVAGALGYFLGIGRHRLAPKRLAQYRAPEVEAGPVDAICGAFMLIRRSALEMVGLFDEGYWMYQEDLDLCYRFHQAGWVTWYEPSVTVWHATGGSSGRIRSLRLTYAFHYGMYRFYRKHYAKLRSPAVNVVVYAGIATKLLVSITRTTLRRAIAGPGT
jgi:GT2 family glycosyltransferase